MSDKRALVVDDSRSARVILSRMLETHGLHVDSVESGEQALEYLRNSHPDVVFMDHLMPGMDGFETVRAIKTNAHTAQIPVMMYTSQEGETYLRAAQKIGAVGVLSKTLQASEVSHALYQLNLLPERREDRATMLRRERNRESMSATADAALSASVPHANNASDTRDALLQAQRAWQNNFDAKFNADADSRFDAVAARLSAELHAVLRQLPMPAPIPERRTGRSILAAALVILALTPTIVLAIFYWRTLSDNKAELEQSAARLAMVVTDQQTQIEQLRTELSARNEQNRDENTPLAQAVETHAPPESSIVQYGELPLAGIRTQQLRKLLERLQTEDFRGRVRIAVFVGDFCLRGNAASGFQIAPATLSLRRCDLIGNPFADALTIEQQQSVEFSNLVAASKFPIDIESGGRKPQTPYPPRSDKLTAGEWNRVAAQNNRVEIFAVATAAQK